MAAFNSEENLELILTLIKEKRNISDLTGFPIFKQMFDNHVNDICKRDISLIEKNKLLITQCNKFFENIIPRYGPAGLCVAPRKSETSKSETDFFAYRARQARDTPAPKEEMTKEKVKYSLCIHPTEIKKDKLIFKKKLGFVKNLYLSKLFVPNIVTESHNFLGQKKSWRLDSEPFIVYSMCINSKIDIINKLFVRKSVISDIIQYDTEEKIVINNPIEHIEMRLTNKLGEPLIIQNEYKITKIINGSVLKKKREINNIFLNKQLFYIFSKKILKPDDLIVIDNYRINIVGSCKIVNNCIEDICHKNTAQHNCNIINMQPSFRLQNYSFQDISNMPILYFSLVLS